MNTTGTTLYAKILKNANKLTWKDILINAKKKRTAGDLDYAMIAGTSLDTVRSETGMLQKWQQPWLYRKVAAVGLGITGLLFLVIWMQILLMGISPLPALNLLLIMVPPCVVPLSLMVLFWEMNAPRDISLMRLLGCFLAGGVLSLLFTVLLTLFAPSSTVSATLAPVTEEPAKLLASLAFLKLLKKKNGRIYGFTGLTVGAAVGAGFAAFESAQYAYNCLPQLQVSMGGIPVAAHVLCLDKTVVYNVGINIVLRSVFSICGHVLYCAPYASLAACNMGKNGNLWSSFASRDFWVLFIVSCLCHGVWNSMPSLTANLVCCVVITIVLWFAALYAIRRSFSQLSANISAGSGAQPLTSLRVQGIRGIHAGVSFTITHQEIRIGSDVSCDLSYPVGLPDIAPVHGKLLVHNGALYLGDLGSSGGTQVNGVQVKPMTAILLKAGDRFTLGRDQEFEVM